MGKTWTLYKRELGDFFNSPIAYIAIVVFLVIAGFIASWKIFSVEVPRAELRPFLELMPLVMVFLAPALAMRLMAEEKSTGTMELLITLPVTDWQVVMSKYLAALTVLGLAILFTLPIPIAMAKMGDLDWGVTAGGYIGLFLMGACYVSIGLMTSSWAGHQVIAFIVSIAICLPFFLLGHEWVTGMLPDGLRPWLQGFFGLGYHFKNISKGILDSRDVIYYLSIGAACLLLATQSLESRKWR